MPASGRSAPPNLGIIFGAAAAVAVVVGLAMFVSGRGRDEVSTAKTSAHVMESEPARPSVDTPSQPQPPTPGGGTGPAVRPPTPATDPTPVARPPVTDLEAQRKAEEEIAATVAALAAKKLQDAKTFAEQSPDDITALRTKLSEIANGYRSTPAGKEAAELLAQLKMPAPPAEEQWQNAIDLLPSVDPHKDAVAGVWEAVDGALVVRAGDHARLQLPYVPPEEYDVRVVLARTSGRSIVGIILPHLNTACTFQVGANNDDRVCGFGMVDGKWPAQNATTVSRSLSDGRHTLIVQVRKTTMRVFLDGEHLTEWRESHGKLILAPDWKLKEVGRLGLITHNAVAQFFSAQVVDVSGKGSLARPQTPVTTPPATPTPAVNPPVLDESVAARASYEDAFAEVAAAAAKELTATTARLEKLRSDPKLNDLQAGIELDLEMFKTLAGLQAAARAGLSTLIKDKRAFTFKLVDGKQQATGGDSKTAIIEFKDDTLALEQDISGGRVASKLGFDRLSPQSLIELARIGLPASAENDLNLGFAALLLQFQPTRDTPLKSVRQRIERAGKNGAPAERVARILVHLEALEKEDAAELAGKQAEQLIADKRLEDARKAVEKFTRDFAGTRAARRLQPELTQHLTELDKKLNPLQPGVWASYYISDKNEMFKKFVFSRAEKNLQFDWGNGSPDPRVPADWFSAVFHGVIRIPHSGKYRFSVAVDDRVVLFLDGNQIIKTDAREKDVELEKGDHVLKVHYQEHTGSALIKLRILDNKQDISASVLYYNPWDTEAYDKEK